MAGPVIFFLFVSLVGSSGERDEGEDKGERGGEDKEARHGSDGSAGFVDYGLKPDARVQSERGRVTGPS